MEDEELTVQTLQERKQCLRRLITQALAEMVDLWKKELVELENTVDEHGIPY